VYGQTLTKSGVARSGNGLETGDEIDLAIGGDVKGQPGELRRGYVYARVDREETGFCVGVVRKLSLYRIASAYDVVSGKILWEEGVGNWAVIFSVGTGVERLRRAPAEV
jgi:hypothetical protein